MTSNFVKGSFFAELSNSDYTQIGVSGGEIINRRCCNALYDKRL